MEKYSLLTAVPASLSLINKSTSFPAIAGPQGA